jgi:hypothetical protein
MNGLLWTLAVLFLIVWAVGFLFAQVAGGLIHLLLILAVVAVGYNLLVGRRTV